ncbi:FAD/NAD(P)-binding protein [Kitasatospora sp. NPDC093550]|uniref:FAD/NAD(P)-binding protein n=1 Tax=Kitasatospora sp. NPDC093550 TaxID=3364089 RepID=UPI00381EDB14
MNHDTTTPRVAVVGAGAAGTLAAVQLLRQADRHGLRCAVELLDPAELPGRGAAYRTPDPRHLLNVPAARMSALPEDPEHFVRWLTTAAGGRYRPADFVPRALYGRYLGELLADTARQCGRSARLVHRRDRVVGLDARPDRPVLRLGSGERRSVDAAVLALGPLPSAAGWAPDALRADARFLRTPWAAGALERIPERGDVLLVGTGLTMADVAVALERPGRTLHAVSRTGLLPERHREHPPPPVDPPALDGLPDLAALRRATLRHLAATRRHCGDWRPGLDALRPVTAALWGGLSAADRARFLREDLRRWEVHRHRLAPPTAARLDALRTAGRLTVRAGRVAGVRRTDGGLRVRLSDGHELHVVAVVDCTGAALDPRTADDPLLRSLLAEGTARPGPAGAGLDTAADGRLLPAGDRAGAPLWTLGAARRGNLLESTAVPEIRGQAADAAAALLRTLPGWEHGAPNPRRSAVDRATTLGATR